MQAIVTKVLWQTNTLGKRIKAYNDTDSVVVSWDWKLPSNYANHESAATQLALKLNYNLDEHPIDGWALPHNLKPSYVWIFEGAY